MLLLNKIIFSKTIITYYILILNIIFFQNIYANNSALDTLYNNEIKSKIIYNATDSIIIMPDSNKIKLYKEAKIEYEKITLEAPYIIIDFSKNEISGKKNKAQKVIFFDGKKYYNSDYLKYNFKTQKGFSRNSRTKENQGFLKGEKIKKNNDSTFFIYKGGYTTCDLEEPHFAIKSRKIKILSNNSIVTGPSYLEINRSNLSNAAAGNKVNIPNMPVAALPFGIFPNFDKNTSGIIFPSYGESNNLGFFLRDMGYHFSFNDYINIGLKGDVYSKGSWGLKSFINYKKRYKYQGSLNLNYASLKNGYRESPSFSDKRDFMIRWTHNKDPKSNPNNRISININLGTSTYHQNNSYNYSDYLNNTLRSNISFNKIFPEKPYNLSVNLGHYQNTITNSVSVTAPNLVFRLNKTNFEKFIGSKNNKIFKNTNFSYTLNFKNELNTIDSILFVNTKTQDFSSGIKHQIPISQSFKLLKYFIVSPSFNYSELWHFQKTNKTIGPLDEITEETIPGFYRSGYYNFRTNMTTKVFGDYSINNKKIIALRHTINPAVSFIYTPQTSQNYFDSYVNLSGNEVEYFLYENNAFYVPNNKKSSKIALNINNIIELKRKSKNDTNNIIKKKIIENFNITTGYDIYAENFNFQLININFSTRVIKDINFNINSTYDPYIWEDAIRTENLHVNNGKIAELKNINLSLDYKIKNNTYIPFEGNIRYNFNYFNESISNNSFNIAGKIDITKKWKINLVTGYDILNKDLSYTSFDIHKDLHCWEMKFKWIPFGYHKSYNILIRVKANILKDLKFEKRKDWFDYTN